MRSSQIFSRRLGLFILLCAGKDMLKEITQSTACIMVRAGDLRANVYLLLSLGTICLLELPWQVVTSPVKLKVLVSLEALVAYFTYISVRCQQCLRDDGTAFGQCCLIDCQLLLLLEVDDRLFLRFLRHCLVAHFLVCGCAREAMRMLI